MEDESNRNIYRRNFSKTNFKGISDEIKKVDWDSTLNGLEIEEAYTRFFICIPKTLERVRAT